MLYLNKINKDLKTPVAQYSECWKYKLICVQCENYPQLYTLHTPTASVWPFHHIHTICAPSAPTFMPHIDHTKSLLYTTMRLSQQTLYGNMRSKCTREGMKGNGDGHTATNWPISSGKLSAVELGYMKVLGQKERRQIYVHLYGGSGQRDVWWWCIWCVKRTPCVISLCGLGGMPRIAIETIYYRLSIYGYTNTLIRKANQKPKTCSPDNYYGYLRWMLWPMRTEMLMTTTSPITMSPFALDLEIP